MYRARRLLVWGLLLVTSSSMAMHNPAPFSISLEQYRSNVLHAFSPPVIASNPYVQALRAKQLPTIHDSPSMGRYLIINNGQYLTSMLYFGTAHWLHGLTVQYDFAQEKNLYKRSQGVETTFLLASSFATRSDIAFIHQRLDQEFAIASQQYQQTLELDTRANVTRYVYYNYVEYKLQYGTDFGLTIQVAIKSK